MPTLSSICSDPLPLESCLIQRANLLDSRHLFDIPKTRSWIKFREWGEKYGPILTLWNGTTPVILISDPEVNFRSNFARIMQTQRSKIATELLDKRSHKYSSRPRFVVTGELMFES